jgi:prepilin-type N-terminal cleavage/methylation domain-containing protein
MMSLSINNIRTRGFTLIELMVVLVIISILTAVIVEEMSGTMHDALLRSASRQLIAEFALASSRAISLNRTHEFRIDRKTGNFHLEIRHHNEFVPVKSLTDSEGSIDSRIHFQILGDGPEDAIAFHSDGTADERAVELRDPEGFGLTLHINPITSRIDVRELEHKEEQ